MRDYFLRLGASRFAELRDATRSRSKRSLHKQRLAILIMITMTRRQEGMGWDELPGVAVARLSFSTIIQAIDEILAGRLKSTRVCCRFPADVTETGAPFPVGFSSAATQSFCRAQLRAPDARRSQSRRISRQQDATGCRCFGDCCLRIFDYYEIFADLRADI